MGDTVPSKALEDCRTLCRQLLSGGNLRRTQSDTDTVCVSSVSSLSSLSASKPQPSALQRNTKVQKINHSAADSSDSRVIFASRLLPEVVFTSSAPACCVTRCRSSSPPTPRCSPLCCAANGMFLPTALRVRSRRPSGKAHPTC